jgi:hypothetical protein
MSCSVFHDWYSTMPWKMQSILANGLVGYYEQDSISEALGYAVFTWVPCEHIPGCLKPFDSIEFAARHESPEPRRFAVAYVEADGKVQFGWYWPEEK